MSCPLCGDICRCSSDANSAASPRWLPDSGDSADSVMQDAKLEAARIEEAELPGAESAPATGIEPAAPVLLVSEPPPEESSVWRQEVAARLNRYQARRKPRPPRYPSLRLRFEEDPGASSGASVEPLAFSQNLSSSNHALALDDFAASSAPAVEASAAPSVEHDRERQEPAAFFLARDPLEHLSASPAPVAPTTAKILEFPRSWTPAPPPLDELAEPVMDRPRILEAPEVVPPPPALGGITIEPAPTPEVEKRPGIDFPLQTAPLPRRIACAAIDAAIIAIAGVLFGFIFWKMTAIRPPRLQLIGLAAGLSALFWATYQYLLVVYSGSTPGLRLAHLELARFDGSPANRRLRRWRVLASFLSAVSLGMGYAWAFLDEDALCWHDRITHTYLAPKR